jgi:integrase
MPIPALLRERLLEHRLGADVETHVFPREDDPDAPFTPHTITRRARRACENAGLDPITLHEARHTAASYLIAAGVNLKAVSVFMGHSNISITLDRYGHLLPGSVDEGAELLDAYLAAQLERAEEAARGADPNLAAASA